MSGFGITLALFALILGLVGLIKLLAWVDRVRERGLSALLTVNHSAVVMSRTEDDAPQNVPSSLRQTAPQTDRPPITREIMLDTYRMLREYGVPRERARPILKAAGIPLDNNLWTEAAPTPQQEPQTVTPIAGRPTNAEFRDPELNYQPPPR